MSSASRRLPNWFIDNSGCIGWKRNALLAGASVLVLTSPVLTTPISAQSYTNYDGSKTNDLNAALATWTNAPEFEYKASIPLQGDWGLSAMNAEYAYVLGLSGNGIKLGSVDSGLLLTHEEFATRGNVTAITISGTYLNDGAQNDGGGLTWKAGDSFSSPGSWHSVADLADHIGQNDFHGSHVSGTIAAAKNGLDANGAGMMGVAFGSQYFITNTNGTDSSIYGSNMDYNYFRQAYGQLAAAGVRAINSSWGNPNSADNVDTVGGMAAAYASLESMSSPGVSTKRSWLDAAADVSLQTGVIQVFAAGNVGQANPSIRASVPYFRTEIEQDWIAVAAVDQSLSLASFSNRCGVAKYWCVSAPGVDINSLQTTSDSAYVSESGTSMAAPHVTGALGLLMERYPSLDNQAIRTILFTTAQHLGSGPADVPNTDFGWGIPDLQKGLNGPGQLLGVFNANMTAGMSDTWSNDISEAALSQRRTEETAEIQAWVNGGKAQLQSTLQPVPAAVDPSSTLIGEMPTARGLLQAVIAANTVATYTPAGFNAALAAANADPGGALLLALYSQAHPGWENFYSLSTDFTLFINGRSDVQLASAIVNVTRDAVLAANAQVNSQITFTQGRVDQLAQKTDKDYVGTLVKTGAGALTLTGNNSYSGGTLLQQGTLGAGSNTALGVGTLEMFDHATLQAAADRLSLGNAVTLSGVGNIDTQAYHLTLAGNVTDGGNGPGGFGKIGSGSLVLSGVNTYSGPTGVIAGTLQAGSTTGLSPNSAFLVNSAALLDLNGFNQTIGSLSGSGNVSLRSATLTTGNDNTLAVFAGTISGAGGLTKSGSGTQVLLGTNTYSGPTDVTAGILDVDSGGSIAASANVSGGTLTGAGTIGGSVTVANGAVFAPGNIAGSAMTIAGSLALQSGAIYVVTIGAAASFADVRGSATLNGNTVNASFAGGGVVKSSYTILRAASGVNGTFASRVATNLPSNFKPSLGYDTGNAYLNLALSFSGLNANQAQVANALSRSFSTAGTIPYSFGTISPAGLTAISGEVATGAQQATFSAMDQFMGVISDVSAAGRGSPNASGGTTGYAEEQALDYAAKRKPPDALAAIYSNTRRTVPTHPYQGWSVWAAGFGGSESIGGNAVAGTTSSTSNLAGTAIGADYRFSPDTIAGFAMAGGGTSFGMTGQGSGNSDLFQAGGFVRHNAGAAYITAALAYGWQDVTINRGADRRRSEFIADAISGRVEGGYRYVTSGIGVTPYAAAQSTTINLPNYAEPKLDGTDPFALSYVGKSVTDPRSELGVRTDRSWAVQDAILTLHGRLAWAHDYNTERSLAVTFQSLPASSFAINGARPAADSALATASAEWKWFSGFSLGATFDGEFSSTTAAYTGKGVVRYQW